VRLLAGALALLVGLTLLAAPASAQRPFDLTATKADRVFFVLGMLMEYAGGRAVRGPDQIELFYCSEKAVVPLFTRVLTALAKEQGLSDDVREEAKQGCLTTVQSPTVAPGLGLFYPRGANSIDLSWFTRSGAPIANRAIAPDDLERRRALAYVAGAWARHRRDRTMLLTAGSGKADRLAALLKALGCRDVRIESSLGASPGSNTVHFEPTAEVSTWLAKTW
jgi:hypothetical protein